MCTITFYITVHIQKLVTKIFHIILLKVLFFFVSTIEKSWEKIKELKNLLKNCNYPDSPINQFFYNAKLQGPSPFTDN